MRYVLFLRRENVTRDSILARRKRSVLLAPYSCVYSHGELIRQSDVCQER